MTPDARAGRLPQVLILEDDESIVKLVTAARTKAGLSVRAANRLKDLDIYTDGSFNRERITVTTDVFMAALDDAFGRDGERIRAVIDQRVTERGREGRLRFVGDLGKRLIGDAAGVTLKALLAAAT